MILINIGWIRYVVGLLCGTVFDVDIELESVTMVYQLYSGIFSLCIACISIEYTHKYQLDLLNSQISKYSQNSVDSVASAMTGPRLSLV